MVSQLGMTREKKKIQDGKRKYLALIFIETETPSAAVCVHRDSRQAMEMEAESRSWPKDY